MNQEINTTVWRIIGRSLIAANCAIGSSVAQPDDRVPGETIPGASVKVGRKPSKDGKTVANASTDAHGQCRFADLPAGNDIVSIEVAGEKHKVETNDAGEPIEIAAPPTGECGTAFSIAVRPVVDTENLGDVIVTVEIVDNPLASNFNLSTSNVDIESSH